MWLSLVPKAITRGDWDSGLFLATVWSHSALWTLSGETILMITMMTLGHEQWIMELVSSTVLLFLTQQD